MDKRKVTNIEVKKNNRNGVFRYIRRRGTASNPDIAYEMKMSLPTATQLTRELIENGLVEEKGELKSTGGRRAKALSVAAGFRQAAGLDITRNHISLVLTNLTGEILKYERMHLPYEPTESYYGKVNGELERFLTEAGANREKIAGIGISFPGIIDLKNEMIVYSHILGVKEVPFADVSRFFSCPCFFINDANAGAYAESFAESLREEGLERFFYLSLSNTVGGAIIDGNELTLGKHFRCGEAGHMTVAANGRRCYCGKKDCLDVYCRAERLSDAAGGKLESFFSELDKENKEMAEIWEEYTDYLAMAVNNIHMILDCDIIIGGYVGSYAGSRIQDLWGKVSDRNTFEESAPYVRACHYKVEAAALGAALQVTEDFVSRI